MAVTERFEARTVIVQRRATPTFYPKDPASGRPLSGVLRPERRSCPADVSRCQSDTGTLRPGLQMAMIGFGMKARTTNQAPTASSTRPLNRFTVGPDVLTGLRAAEPTALTMNDATTNSVTKMAAARPNATTVAGAPTVRDCAVRPTSRGPVHPNPASR